MGLLKTKIMISSTAILLMAEVGFAYNADQHEARIRRSCNSLRDGEERMGCFNGDITIIEQIRRRQRAEERRQRRERQVSEAFSPDYAPSRPSRKVPRATPVEAEVAETPSYEPEVAPAPAESEGAAPQLISQPAPEAPKAPPVAVTAPAIPVPVQDILPGPREVVAAPASQAPNESTHAKGNPTQRQSSAPAREQKPAESTVKKEDSPKESTTAKTPEAAKSETQASAPALPTTFPMTCAETYKDLEKKPHLKEAMARIMNAAPQKRGEIRSYPLKGWSMNPANCLGLFTRTLRNCQDQSPSDKTITRIDSETGRIQAYIAGQWVSQKACSDGKKIVSSASLSKSGFTFHFKTTVRQVKGQVYSETSGYLENDPSFQVKFGENYVMTHQENSRMIASQGRAPRGRN